MAIIERYFVLLPEKERNVYFDMSYVLTPSEQREFASLDQEGRNTFWNHYWRTRNPNPKTQVNERLLEHFIRVAFSRIEFGKAKWPWDERGDFMVRYGEPDERMGPGRPFPSVLIDDWEFYLEKKELYLQLGLPPPWYDPDKIYTVATLGFDPRVDGSGTPERWLYLDKGIDISFLNPVMSGRYINRSNQFIETMERHIPVMSEEEEKIETFDPLDSVVTFKGTNGRTIVEYAFALLPEEFGAFRSVTGTYATIDVKVDLYSETWKLIAETDEKAKRLRTIPQIQIRGIPLFVDATRMEVDPGTYQLTTMLLDPETGKRATTEEMVELPNYSGSELMVSSILPAAMITPVNPGQEGTFIRNNLQVLPLPGRALQVDQPLFIYYEIYNLDKDQFGGTDYTVDYSVAEAPQDIALATRLFQGLASLVGVGRKRAVITSTVSGSGITSDVRSFLEIDLSGLPPQTYELELQVTDTLNGNTATSYLLFRTLPPPEIR